VRSRRSPGKTFEPKPAFVTEPVIDKNILKPNRSPGEYESGNWKTLTFAGDHEAMKSQ